MKNFQVIVLIIFGVLAALAVAFFSGAITIPQKAKDSPTGGATGTVVMWGTVDKGSLRDILGFINKNAGGQLSVSYVEKNPATIQKELLDSFAFGGTPDLFFMSNDLIKIYGDKVVTVPYQGFTDRMFSDSYIQSANVFKIESGILGFPILSDPLVMFYNKDHFDSKGIAVPPKTWKELTALVPLLTEKNELLEIKKSGLAFGESKNIQNFKEILLAMNMQLGNQVVSRDATKAIYTSVLNSKSYISSKPAEETLKYYLEFSNPLKSVYSWNKSMPDARSAFVGGDLSVYFGFASEIALLQKMNPNLNFDVTTIPQVEGTGASVTYARVYALAIPKTTKNFQGAYYVASQLANGELAGPFSLVAGLSPVRRDILIQTSTLTKFTDVYYKAALQSRSWVDPDQVETNRIFSDMIENVLSGLKDYGKSVNDANTELKVLLSK